MKLTVNSKIEFVRTELYTGVLIDGEPLPQTVVRHSPTGFEFGYGGSGPADLALNILSLVCTPDVADKLHQDFKWKFIANAAKGQKISGQVIFDWIKNLAAKEGGGDKFDFVI